MSDQNSQDDKHAGGYMAVYHDIEEIFYGPLGGLPALARVLYCIRHKLLRDGLGQKAIGHTFVMERTGLTKAQVINSAKKLAANGLIIIKADSVQSANGKVRYFENKYELNPLIFGDDYNWYKNNPTVRVYSSDKVGSYSRKGVSPSGIKSDTRGGIRSDTRVVPDLIPRGDPRLAELLAKIDAKNPSSKNPKDKNPSSADLDFKEKKTRTPDEQARIIREQVERLKTGTL